MSLWTCSPVFPHEPTSNQWFTEAQFESYRMLGAVSADAIAPDVNGTDGLRRFSRPVWKASSVGRVCRPQMLVQELRPTTGSAQLGRTALHGNRPLNDLFCPSA